MHLGQARGLVIGLVQPGLAQEDDDDDTVAMVNVNGQCRWSWFVAAVGGGGDCVEWADYKLQYSQRN